MITRIPGHPWAGYARPAPPAGEAVRIRGRDEPIRVVEPVPESRRNDSKSSKGSSR